MVLKYNTFALFYLLSKKYNEIEIGFQEVI